MKGRTISALLAACLAPATMLARQTPSLRSIPVAVHSAVTAQTNTKAIVLDVSADTHQHVIRDVLFGTIAGAAVGVLVGSSTNKGSKEDRELAGLSGGILGAGVGAIVGAVIGFTHKSAGLVLGLDGQVAREPLRQR